MTDDERNEIRDPKLRNHHRANSRLDRLVHGERFGGAGPVRRLSRDEIAEIEARSLRDDATNPRLKNSPR